MKKTLAANLESPAVEPSRNFGEVAGKLSRNPLGIIALFIVLVYGIAALVLSTSINNLEPSERMPLIWFLVIFPVLVLFAFLWLVTKFPRTLYSPKDFQTEEGFLEWVRGSASKEVKEVEILRQKLSQPHEQPIPVDSKNSVQPSSNSDPHDVAKIIDERIDALHSLYKFAQQSVFFNPAPIQTAALRSLEREPKSVPIILLLDVVNFTKYVEEHGPLEAGSILDVYQTIVTKSMQSHGGSEISRVGDGHLLLFSGPLAAIRSALALIADLKEHPYMKRLSEGMKIRAAIGLHTEILDPNQRTKVEKIQRILNPNEIGLTELVAQTIVPGTFKEGTLREVEREGVRFAQVVKEGARG